MAPLTRPRRRWNTRVRHRSTSLRCERDGTTQIALDRVAGSSVQFLCGAHLLPENVAPRFREDVKSGVLICPVPGCPSPELTTRAYRDKRDHFMHVRQGRLAEGPLRPLQLQPRGQHQARHRFHEGDEIDEKALKALISSPRASSREPSRRSSVTSDNTLVPNLLPTAERFPAFWRPFSPIWRHFRFLDLPDSD